MTIAELIEYVELCRTKNYLRASENLYISQSSLSRHIQAMERETGETLFVRSTQKVELTKAGEKFLYYAEKICGLWTECCNEMDKTKASGTFSSIVVGFSGAMAPYNINRILSDFQIDYPDIKINLVKPNGNEWQLLDSGQCDLVLCSNDLKTRRKDASVRIIRDFLTAVVSEDHPLARETEIPVLALQPYTLALMDHFSKTGSSFMTACKEAGFMPRYRYSDGTDLIDRATLSHEISIMTAKPASYFADESVQILKIVPEIWVSADLYVLKESLNKEKIRTFVNYLKSEKVQNSLI